MDLLIDKFKKSENVIILKKIHRQDENTFDTVRKCIKVKSLLFHTLCLFRSYSRKKRET